MIKLLIVVVDDDEDDALAMPMVGAQRRAP